MRRLALLLLLACKNGQQPGSEITVSPATASASASATATASATASATAAASASASAVASASVSVPDEPSFGAAWLSCRKDTDCTVVSLGCCHWHAVNRAHAKDGQKALDDSGLSYCPAKAACPAPQVKCAHAICTL